MEFVMFNDEITLVGNVEYNPKFPPKNAGKGYVARIRGRSTGPMKYDREFMGRIAPLSDHLTGLYEVQTGLKKGGTNRRYYVLLSHPEYGLMLSSDCSGDENRIVRQMTASSSIDEVVEPLNIRPNTKEGYMTFDVKVRTLAEIEKVKKSTTVQDALEECWGILKLLPEKEAKEVISNLRKKLKSVEEAVS
jgi:hypothetical protein